MNIIFDDAAEIHKSKIQVASPDEVFINLFNYFILYLCF